MLQTFCVQSEVYKVPAALCFCLDTQSLTPTDLHFKSNCTMRLTAYALMFLFFFDRSCLKHQSHLYMHAHLSRQADLCVTPDQRPYCLCVSLSRMSRQELVTELFYFFVEDLKCAVSPPSPLLSSLMLFSLCLYAWFINSCHSVAQITEVLRFLPHIRGFFFIKAAMAQPKQNTSQWNQCFLNFQEETEEK